MSDKQTIARESHTREVAQTRANDEGGYVEEKTQEASASANGGINLNIFGALSGALSSKEKKTSDGDGHGETTEKQKKLAGAGAGAGNFNANAAGAADMHKRELKET